jgi:hypothetical protein
MQAHRKLGTAIALLMLLTIAFISACGSGRTGTSSIVVPMQAERSASLITPQKAVDVPPLGDANKVTALAYHIDESNNYILTWPYRLLGDYNLTLNVDVSDITPIAMHFGETWDPVTSPNSAASVVDGSGNLRVGVEDITQIAMNYNRRCVSYSVRGADTIAGPYTEVGNAPCPVGSPLDNGWPVISFDLGAAPSYAWYQVVPLDTDSNLGIESRSVHIVPGGGGGLVLVLDTPATNGTGIEASPFLITVHTAYTVHCEDDYGNPVTSGITLHSIPPFFVSLVSTSPYSVTANNLMAGDFQVWAESNTGPLTSNQLFFRVDQTLP